MRLCPTHLRMKKPSSSRAASCTPSLSQRRRKGRSARRCETSGSRAGVAGKVGCCEPRRGRDQQEQANAGNDPSQPGGSAP